MEKEEELSSAELKLTTEGLQQCQLTYLADAL
jgi:hypothetical protein